MSFLSRARESAGEFDDYRITSAVETLALLQRIEAARALVTLSTPDGHDYTTLIWSIDSRNKSLAFSGDSRSENLKTLERAEELTATAHLDSIKVQFRLPHLRATKQDGQDVLLTVMPEVLYRFQRRTSFRVTPTITSSPSAQFPHPEAPEHQLCLRVMDVSLGGVALHLPEDVPAISDGTRIPRCSLRLDDETWLDVSLVMRHATKLNTGPRGSRLGCEFAGQLHSERDLQHYINQTQKRQLALAGRKV